VEVPSSKNRPALIPVRGTPWKALNTAVRALADPVFALLFPSSCRLCKQPIESWTRVPICPACWLTVRPSAGVACTRCGIFLERPALLHGTAYCGVCRRNTFAFEQARSFAWYEGALRDIVVQFKYRGLHPLAKPLASYLAHALDGLDAGPWDLVLPVPLHRRRERHRGFNQAALLAAQIGRLRGIRVAKDCVRVLDTRPQTGLRRAERRKNVKGAFAVPHPERIRGRRILLVDDVLTTGATADACARALQDAGAKGVWVITLARARAAASDVL
jgi:ComF family protein